MAELVVTYRNRRIDLDPYFAGFPYVGFECLPQANLLLYFHDLPERRVLKAQPLDQPFDPAHGRTLGDADWNLRSFASPVFDRVRDAVLFLGDESNDEVFNVYSLALSSGALTRLTDVPYTYAFKLSHDQSRLAYVARYNADGQMRAELRLRDMTSGADMVLVADTPQARFTWGKLLWSEADDALLAPVNLDGDRNRSNLVHISLASPRLVPLLPDAPRSALGVMDEWLDDDHCLIVNNQSGYMQVERLDVRMGARTALSDEPHDLRSAQTAKVDGRVLVATVRDRPQDSPLRVLDPQTGETLWQHVEQGSVTLLNSGERDLYGVSTSLDEKWALWHLRVGNSTIWQKIATMPSEIIAATSHAHIEQITYPTFDTDAQTGETRQIHSFLLIPKDLPPPAERRALVQAFYGGANSYNQTYQILAQAGFIVLAPAVRGSFGFGREFYALIDKDLGGNEMIDLIYGARYLQARFGLEPHQIGAFGGSHGGFAALRALTLPNPINGRAEHFDWGFGWAHAGFFDITTFWRDCNIPDWVTQKAGDPIGERERLLDRSPLYHAEKLRAPVYLTHGDRDNRVPVNESRVLAARLEVLNKHFHYDEFEGHGHALKGIGTQLRLWRGLMAFLEQA